MDIEDKVTIVVGDMHLKENIILPMVDKAMEIAKATSVVLCGDYMDDWGADDTLAIRQLETLAEWLDGKRAAGVDVTPLIGNHDFCYLKQFAGCGTQMGILHEAKEILDGIDLKVATVVDGRLITHAGLTEGWRKSYMPDTIDAEHAADAINDMLESDTWSRCLYEAGFERGGTSFTPGPLWADAEELLDDPASGIGQIVGHTPMRHVMTELAGDYDDDGSKSTLTDISFCDTFSLRGNNLTPIGDGSMLIVSKNGIKSITNVGLWRQSAADYRVERGYGTSYLDDELDTGKWVIDELL